MIFGRARKEKRDLSPPAPQSPAPQSPATDPLTAARGASDAVFDALVRPLKVDHGVPSEAVVMALGALAGRACLLAAIAGKASGAVAYQTLSLMEVGLVSGERALMGDALNRTLIEWQYSVWSLAAGIAPRVGAAVPDIGALAAASAGSLGKPEFGTIHGVPPGVTPQGALGYWGLVAPLVRNIDDPDYVPVVFALAYQRFVQTEHAYAQQVRATAEQQPGVATAGDLTEYTRIFMESALAASKVMPNG